eukprot:sb/3466769/
MRPHEHVIATGTGGLLVALLATPFDVLKTRLIAQSLHTHNKECYYRYCKGVLDDVCVSCGHAHPPQLVYRGVCQKVMYTGTWDAAVRISRSEGVFALWNGVTPTLLMIVPSAVLYFTSFDYMRNRGKDFVREAWHPIVPSISGVLSRSINVAVFSPIEMVRTKAQSENQLDYGKLKESIKRHISLNGRRSLWDGSRAQLLRDIPFTAVYWYLQERVKLRLAHHGTVLSNMGGAVTGGLVATLISHPFDLAKTQVQSSIGVGESEVGSRGLIQQLTHVTETQGFRGLFVGLIPRMTKVIPSCTIFITTFEAFKEYFTAKEQAVY